MIVSHTMPRQRDEPTPTSLGQVCMRVYLQPVTCTFGGMTVIFYEPQR